MGQIKFFTSVIMAGLFALAMVFFAINFGVDNNAAIALGDDSDFTSLRTELQGNLSQFTTDSNVSGNAFMKSSIESGDMVTATGGQFKVGVVTMMGITYSVMVTAYIKIFGSDSGFGIFLTALASILAWIAFLYAYKTWVGRNPD